MVSHGSLEQELPLSVWYLGHCGFAVRVGNKLLVFDYLSERGRPSETPTAGGLQDGVIDAADLAGLDVYVFVTIPTRITTIQRLEWERQHEKTEYFLG